MMRYSIRHHFCLVLALLFPVTIMGQDEGRRVVIETSDSVRLQGSFYPGKGSDAPCVMLLHDFDVKKGGNRDQGGWTHLAKELSKKGYHVLSFDFRGHGQSTNIDKKFWDFPHNRQLVRGFNPNDPPTTLSQTNFTAPYYKHLVNDIAAAKSYLDRKNDTGELNTSNLIVIGAGDGGTLGVMWMISEWRRKKAIVAPGDLIPRPYPLCQLDEPEGRDQMCGVFLNLSTTIAGQGVPLRTWLKDLGGINNVPLVFIYGKDDPMGSQLAQQYLVSVDPGFAGGKRPSKKELQFTGHFAVPDTKLVGSELLDESLATTDFIVEKYIEPLKQKRGVIEPRDRQFDKNVYYWEFARGRATLANNAAISDKAPVPIPVDAFIPR